MKLPGYVLLILCVAATAGEQPAYISAADIPFPAQELVAARASGEVISARWTRRPDSYELQLVHVARLGEAIANLRGLDPTFGSSVLASLDGQRQTQIASGTKASRTQVWLLQGDGTQVSPVRSRSTTQVTQQCLDAVRKSGDIAPAGSMDRPDSGCRLQAEAVYSFSFAEGQQAVAVAIRIDGDYFIEKLQPLQRSVVAP